MKKDERRKRESRVRKGANATVTAKGSSGCVEWGEQLWDAQDDEEDNQGDGGGGATAAAARGMLSVFIMWFCTVST
jgi:hypothetical protein